MEIVIEIKQLYPDQMASNPSIASYRRYMVYQLRDDFPIEMDFKTKNKVNGRKIIEILRNKCSHWALRLILIGKDAHWKGNIKHA